MRAIIDELVALIHGDKVFRRRVQNYVLTMPNTHGSGLAFRYVREHPQMPKVATREHLHVAAHLSQMKLHASRVALMQRKERDSAAGEA